MKRSNLLLNIFAAIASVVLIGASWIPAIARAEGFSGFSFNQGMLHNKASASLRNILSAFTLFVFVPSRNAGKIRMRFLAASFLTLSLAAGSLIESSFANS